ncbi:EamA family transporter [Calothrix sp. 336/3]|uniref:EamA family transporter n=1 Tax=Calothrix sp. 336/3 TaxID=1337936 RepID=UPI0004E2E214|nr:EamA family transporter [Calothrix sp. 336/3]AKG20824.1 hypothetical protein IJ00_05435 [Calothrix sp. 336/3]
MGIFENQSDNQYNSNGDPSGAAEKTLRAVTEELRVIQQTWLKSSQEDIQRLQGEKIRLIEDIKRLQQEKESHLQGRQISEMQGLISQLAQVLANHISGQLQSSMDSLATQAMAKAEENMSVIHPQAASQLLGSLDDTFTITLNTLQQELRNHQSAISQQLLRMQSQQLQAETILSELVERLRQELENTNPKSSSFSTSPVVTNPPGEMPTTPRNFSPTFLADTELPRIDSSHTRFLPDEEEEEEEEEKISTPVTENPPRFTSFFPQKDSIPPSPPAPVTDTRPSVIQSPSKLWQSISQQTRLASPSMTGIVLIVLSVVLTSLYNVAMKVIFQPGTQIFGVFDAPQLLTPTLGNALLILLLRMVVVVPMILLLAPILHPHVRQDLQNLFTSITANSQSHSQNAQRLLLVSVVSGAFLFLSQLFLYLAIGQLATGMAIALSFIYPLLAGLLAWVMLRDRPTKGQWVAIAVLVCGQLLVLGGNPPTNVGNPFLGSIAAIISGIMFAFYITLSRVSANKQHPVTFTVIHFSVMLVLAAMGLIFPLPASWSIQISPTTNLLELVLLAFFLDVLTVCGYVFTNISNRKLGAIPTTAIGAMVPAFTVICAGLMIQETLGLLQVLGVIFVTIGAVVMSWQSRGNT